MQEAVEKMHEIEKQRSCELMRLRALSMGILVASLLVDLFDTVNNFEEFVSDKWVISAIGITTNVVSIFFEYLVRWRTPLVEGPSKQLITIRTILHEAYAALDRLNELEKSPEYVETAAVSREKGRILEAIVELEKKITYEESTIQVVAGVRSI